MFIVGAARWVWRKVKKAIIFLFGGSAAESATQEKTDERTQESSTAREQKDSSSWERGKAKAGHAWMFFKALLDAILFPEEVKISYSKVQAFFGWVKQSWGSLKFLLCHPKILAVKVQAWMCSLWKAALAWFAKGFAFMTSTSGIAVAAIVIAASGFLVAQGDSLKQKGKKTADQQKDKLTKLQKRLLTEVMEGSLMRCSGRRSATISLARSADS